jgi:hypothetical protein
VPPWRCQQGDRPHVERGERFIEYPQCAAPVGQQPGQRDAATLPLRQAACRHVETGGQPDGDQRVEQVFFRQAFTGDGRTGPQVFQRREVVLHRIAMTEIEHAVAPVIAYRRDRRAAPAQFARLRLRQAAQDAQQTGLATAVGTRDMQQLTRSDRQVQPGKQPCASARASQCGRLDQRCIGFGHAAR